MHIAELWGEKNNLRALKYTSRAVSNTGLEICTVSISLIDEGVYTTHVVKYLYILPKRIIFLIQSYIYDT
jgi:hypothetical protein